MGTSQAFPKVDFAKMAADTHAELDRCEARVTELEALIEVGTATDAHRAELEQVQMEADFYFGVLDDMGEFNPPQENG